MKGDHDGFKRRDYPQSVLSHLYFDGDVVVVELSLNGTHRGDLPMGLGVLPATRKEFHVPCIDVFHVEDGKVSAFDCHYAGTVMLAQFGVLGNPNVIVHDIDD